MTLAGVHVGFTGPQTERMPAPPLRVLRVAVDGTRLLYRTPIPAVVWERLVTDSEFALSLPGEPVLFERRGLVDAEATRMLWTSELGVRLEIYHPDEVDVQAGRYAVNVHMQGLLCSSSRDGIAAIDRVRPAIERYLYGEQELPASDSGIGVTAVCADLEVGGPTDLASAWIEEEVFRGARMDEWPTMWRTRARRTSVKADTIYEDFEEDVEIPRMVDGAPQIEVRKIRHKGSRKGGRTTYFGTDPELKIYEKDRHTKARDLPLVKARWREAGWDGESRVIRIEWTVTRDWLSKNQIIPAGQPLPGTYPALRPLRPCVLVAPPLGPSPGVKRLAGPAGLPWAAVVEWIPSLAFELSDRFTMTDLSDTKRDGTPKRPERRRTHPMWELLQSSLVTWSKDLAASYGVAMEDWATGEIMSTARRYTKERAERRAETSLLEWWSHVVNERPDIGIASAAAIITEKILHRETSTPIDILEKRVALRQRRVNLRPSDWGYGGKPIEREPIPEPVAAERNRVMDLLGPLLESLDGTHAGDLVARALHAIERGELPPRPPEPPPDPPGVEPVALDAPEEPPPPPPPPVRQAEQGRLPVGPYDPDPWRDKRRR